MFWAHTFIKYLEVAETEEELEMRVLVRSFCFLVAYIGDH